MSESNNQNNMNGKDFLLGAVVGGIIGAAAALLLAPKAGKELRGDIAEQYQNVSEKTREIYGTVSAKGREVTGKAKEVAVNVASDIRSWKGSRLQAPALESGAEQIAAAAEESDLAGTDK